MKKGQKEEKTTKYGEFVCSNYNWLPIEEQKRKSKKMEKMTNRDK